MSKSRRFVTITVFVMVILLVIGNWVTPVQANSANTIMLTPTGTPTVEPKNPGESISAEQQEEIENIIYSYFEMRYHALSISQPHGFRPDGFGDLVSDGDDGKAFLSAELDKLALEIKYAELNHSRYVDYKYSLKFSDFIMDTSTQLATVSMVEDNEIIYEIAVERNPTNPHITQMSGLKHTIVLQQEQNQWKIVSDDYNDFLWRTLRRTGKKSNEILARLNASKTPALTELRGESTAMQTLSLLDPDSSSHAYDRAGAVSYAINHAVDANYNMHYPSYDDQEHGDCTNFVSQALYEGGNISMYIPTDPPPSPDPVNGQSGWYLLNGMLRASDWNDVDGFYRFVNDRSLAITEGPEGYELGPVDEGQVPAGLMLGDVIQYNEEDDAVWDHSAIVIDFDAVGAPIVASHSPNLQSADFMTVVAHQKMRFIHIERSDGYSPIKVQTISAADDAGGNPTGNPCPNTNGDVGNNYLGGCFNGGPGVVSGFLFRNVQIPKGAQIKYAYVTFTTDGTYTTNPEDIGDVYAPIRLQIYGENTSAPSDFSTTNTPANRTNLTPGVEWRIDGTVNDPAYDKWHWLEKRTSPDITNIVHSITGLTTWNSGNTLSLIFRNGVDGSVYPRRVVAFEGVPPGYLPARFIAAYDIATSSLPYTSVGAQDGMVLESSENSNKGGSYNSNATTFFVGDDTSNKQNRGFLHFNTNGLPANAIITSVELKIKQESIHGTTPFETHGSLLVDIKQPYFGNGASLAKSDFEDTASVLSGAAIFDSSLNNGWYTASFNPAAFSYINRTGTTQFRLAFALDDNNDFDPDYVAFYSGDDTNAGNRPQLIITYYIPTP